MKFPWKNAIYLIDDAVPLALQEEIKSTLLGQAFPWYLIPDVTGGGSKDQRPAVRHIFARDGKVTSSSEKLEQIVHPLLQAALEHVFFVTKIKANYSLVNSRTFMQFPLFGAEKMLPDAHHIDMKGEHLSVLYYVNDSDGDTLLFENMYSESDQKAPDLHELRLKQRIKPKQGRMVIFDGYYWHTAGQPKGGLRCVINSNVVQSAK